MKKINKGDFINNLSKEEFDAGLIKFNIPEYEDRNSINGEGVWGWITKEDKEKYDNDSFNGNIKAILCNTPLNYYGFLNWGDELQLKCHGDFRPTVDPDWIDEIVKEEG